MSTEKKKDVRDEWKLESIKIEFKGWGQDKGKYVGKIVFANGHDESFSFKIRPEMANQYIEMIAADIVLGAKSLGDRLLDSLQKQGAINLDDFKDGEQ